MGHRDEQIPVEHLGSSKSMKILEYIKLTRIQSAPLTIVTLILGYGVTTDTFIVEKTYPLILMGLSGHLGFYTMNEYFDREYDETLDKSDKPLVSGEVSYEEALAIMVGLILVSFTTALATLPLLGALIWVVAMVNGATYNYYCKETPLSAVCLAVWGFLVVATGSMYAGPPNPAAVVLAASMALFMLLMTAEGELKDMREDSGNMARALGCRVHVGRLSITTRFNAFFGANLIAMSLMIWYLGYLGTDYILAVTTITALTALLHLDVIQMEYSPENMKKRIALATFGTSISVITASSAFMPDNISWVLGIFTAIWGFGWQKILYGDSLYFS